MSAYSYMLIFATTRGKKLIDLQSAELFVEDQRLREMVRYNGTEVGLMRLQASASPG